MEVTTLEIILTIVIAVLLGVTVHLLSGKEEPPHPPPPTPKKPKILVPGKGIFTQPPPKRRPKYWSEAELWAKEQDER